LLSLLLYVKIRSCFSRNFEFFLSMTDPSNLMRKQQIRVLSHGLFLLFFCLFFSSASYSQDNPEKCLKGDCQNGQGRFVTVYGKIYTGEIKRGLPEGKGLYVHPDGKTFYGYWKSNKLNGYGVYISPDGYKYVGEWEDGKFHGQGTLKFPDGKKITGEFKTDKFVGIVKSKPKDRMDADLINLLKESESITVSVSESKP